MMEKGKQTVSSLDERLNRISDRIEGLRTGKIPLSVPVLHREGHHFWIDEERPAEKADTD